MLPSDLKASRVFKLGFIMEEANELPICSFKHHLPIPHGFHVEVVSYVVNIKGPIPHNVVNVFENAQKDVEMCNILKWSSVLIDQHPSGTKW